MGLIILKVGEFIKLGVIQGGMILKVEMCIKVIKNGVEVVVIVDGCVLYVLLLEFFIEYGVGMLIG